MSIDSMAREYDKKFGKKKHKRRKRRLSMKAYTAKYHTSKGWYGEPYRHYQASMGIQTRKRNLTSGRIEYAMNPSQRPKRIDSVYSGVRTAQSDYAGVQRQARREGATPPPTIRDTGYNAKYVTPENVNFYATRSGRIIKGALKAAGEAKAKADKRRAEQAYINAQKKAAELKLKREQDFLDKQAPSTPTPAVVEDRGGVSTIAHEVQEKEKKKGFFSRFRK